MMDRDEALRFVESKVGSRNLINHMKAAEFVMRYLAEKFGEDVEKWGLAGLLHDIDYDTTAKDPRRHSKVGAAILRDAGFDEDICHAVLAHNEVHDEPRMSRMDKALHAVDPLTGLIVAAALVMPNRKLASVTGDMVKNRFREKGFAKGANRQQIMRCTELGMGLEEFIEAGLLSMQGRSAEIGL